jgi:hypothetical protein
MQGLVKDAAIFPQLTPIKVRHLARISRKKLIDAATLLDYSFSCHCYQDFFDHPCG